MQAAALGADAVLLIVAILTDQELSDFIRIADSLGLDALVEAHDAEEIERAASCGAQLIGINNRDLQTFHVDLQTSLQLVNRLPGDCLAVSESGIATSDDLRRLQEAGFAAVLVGETLMRATDRRAALQLLRGEKCG